MASLFTYLSCRDAPAAIDWLEAIGFRVATRQPGDDGTLLHAELRLGDAVVMLASADADYTVPPLISRSTGSGLYLLVEDVDSIYAAAIEASGPRCPSRRPRRWGTDRARVLDPEGHEWSCGTYNQAAGGEVPEPRPLGPEANHALAEPTCRRSLRNPETKLARHTPHCRSGASSRRPGRHARHARNGRRLSHKGIAVSTAHNRASSDLDRRPVRQSRGIRRRRRTDLTSRKSQPLLPPHNEIQAAAVCATAVCHER